LKYYLEKPVDISTGIEKVSPRRTRKRDILLGTWNVRSLYRAGSLTAAARELARYKLDVEGVQEVRWDKEDTVRAGGYNFLYGKGNQNPQLETGFLVHQRIASAVKRVEFVSNRMSYIILTGRGCNIIVLMYMYQVRKRVMSQKIVFMRNYSRFFLPFPQVPYEISIRRL
jgi:hypothetical protein